MLYSSFSENFLLCRYYGSIDAIQIVPKNLCESTLYMYINGIRTGSKEILNNLVVSQPLYTEIFPCPIKNKDIKYDWSHLPRYGTGTIADEGGAILNADTGFKYRFNTKIVENSNSNIYLNNRIPICKGTIVQEYGIGILIGIGIGSILFVMILYIFIKKCFKKLKHKK